MPLLRQVFSYNVKCKSSRFFFNYVTTTVLQMTDETYENASSRFCPKMCRTNIQCLTPSDWDALWGIEGRASKYTRLLTEKKKIITITEQGRVTSYGLTNWSSFEQFSPGARFSKDPVTFRVRGHILWSKPVAHFLAHKQTGQFCFVN